MPPTVPINHYDGPRNQQNRTKRPILLFHANIFEQYACFEHSNFFKVKVPVRQEPQGLKVSQKERPRWKSSTRKNRTGQPGPKFNYELFNCNNFTRDLPRPSTTRHASSPPSRASPTKQSTSTPAASDQGPHYPTLRANPYPEVTDLFCRLPLSTLFYQLEAVHLGDLLRLSVRPGMKTIPSCGFSRAVTSAPEPAKVLASSSHKTPSPDKPIPG